MTLSIMALGVKTLSILTILILNMMTLSLMQLSIGKLSVLIHSISTLNITKPALNTQYTDSPDITNSADVGN